MEIWKVGSNWHPQGKKEFSIMDIFLKYEIVFAYKNIRNFSSVQEGDLIAIADGYKIQHIGRAEATPQDIIIMNKNFTSADKKRFSYSADTSGIRVTINKVIVPILYQCSYRFTKIADKSIRQQIKRLWG